MGDSLVRYVVISALLHVLVSGGVAGFATLRPKPARVPVYKAQIVSMPGPKGATALTPQKPAETVKPAPTPPAPPKEEPKPKPKPKEPEQVKTAKEKKATQPVPTKKKIVEEEKPKEEVKAPPDRRTGGFKGKKIEEPAAPATQLPGGGSATVGVDAADFTYSYYLVTVQDKIAREWDPPAGVDREIFTVIYFQIERDGRIVRPEVESSSGNPLFDETARRAVQRAILPPLPLEFNEERLGVHFQFEYTP